MMMWTSSTPCRPSSSSTISRIVWRTSGVFIGGSGSEMSSIAIVTFIPGASSAYSGSVSSGWLIA